MEFCASNKIEVMKYLKKRFLIRLVRLSKRIKAFVICFLRSEPIKTNSNNHKFIKLAKNEGIAIFPQDFLIKSLKMLSSNSYCEETRTLQNINSWLQSNVTVENDCLIVKLINRVDCFTLKKLNYKIHFEKANSVVFTKKTIGQVKIGSVKEVQIDFITDIPLPIKNSKSVEEVAFVPTSEFYSGTFLEQFTRLKGLYKHASMNSSYCIKSPRLPYLEFLYIFKEKIIIDTIGLRRIHFKMTFIDYKCLCFILKQSRLITLILDSTYLPSLIKFPLTVKYLKLNFTSILVVRNIYEKVEDDGHDFNEGTEDYKDGEHKDSHENFIIEKCKNLSLRKFRTNVSLRTIERPKVRNFAKIGVKSCKREKNGHSLVCSRNLNLFLLCRERKLKSGLLKETNNVTEGQPNLVIDVLQHETEEQVGKKQKN